MAAPLEIDVETLDQMRRDGTPHVLLDVREAWELDICAVDGAIHIPLGRLPECRDELPKDKPIVVMCHHGGRSAQAMMFLRQVGYGEAINLAGGIDSWARLIDTKMKVY